MKPKALLLLLLCCNSYLFCEKEPHFYCDLSGKNSDQVFFYNKNKFDESVQDIRSSLHENMQSYVNSLEYQQLCLQRDEERRIQKEGKEKEIREEFGIGSNKLEEVVRYKKEVLLSWIIQNKKLSKHQAFAIWNKRCTQSYFYNYQKDPFLSKIHDEFAKRKKEKCNREEILKVEKEQKALQVKRESYIKKQHELVNNGFSCDFISEELLQKRQEALEFSQLEGFQQYDEHYELDNITRGYLQYKGVNPQAFDRCFGTALQQQYHAEICEVIFEVAHEHHKSHYSKELYNSAYEFADAAHESNQKNQVTVTGVLCSIAQGLLDIGRSIYNKPG